MDRSMFDALSRRLATGHTRRAMFRGLVGGGVFLSTGAGATLARPAVKVTICHKPGTPAEATLTVGEPAAQAHLAHGDHLGPCDDACDEGAVECDGTGFNTCSNGVWVYRDCAPETACQTDGDSVICDWA